MAGRGVPGALICSTNRSVACLVSFSPGGSVTGRVGSGPRSAVACKILLAISVLSGVDSGKPGGGPGDLGDAEEGVRRLTTLICCDSWLKAPAGRPSIFCRKASQPVGAWSARRTSSSAGVGDWAGPFNRVASRANASCLDFSSTMLIGADACRRSQVSSVRSTLS